MRTAILAALLSLPLCAQPPVVPDCFIQMNAVTVTGASASFDNRGFFCFSWAMNVQFRGFTGASVQLESAPDNNGVPGTWTAFAGTIASGSNPITVYTQNSGSNSETGFFPWVRINITSLTGAGSITPIASGFRPIAAASAGSSGTTAVNVTQLGGLAVSACNAQALFNFSSSGNSQLVAASGTNRILICHYDVAFNAGLDFKLTYGTGVNCGTGTTDLTGLKKSILTDAEDYGPFSSLIVPAGNALCGNPSTNAAGGLTIVYAQIP